MAAVRTKHVTIYSPEGGRLKQAVWGKPRLWKKYKTIANNLKHAIIYARKVLEKQKIGTIVYIGDVPVYHCKWGGGREFAGWKNNPAGEFWRLKLR